MSWLNRLFRRSEPKITPPVEPDLAVALPLLVHTHSKSALPPGPLEEGLVALEQEDIVLHAVAGIVQSDGTIHELPEEKLEWARRLTYRHLKREGCLAEFGIPIIAAYESEEGGKQP
jgi:hypothetical protein